MIMLVQIKSTEIEQEKVRQEAEKADGSAAEKSRWDIVSEVYGKKGKRIRNQRKQQEK